MASKRGLRDAVNDQVIKKESAAAIQAKKRGNRLLLKICVAVALSFVGGFTLGRWAKLL